MRSDVDLMLLVASLRLLLSSLAEAVASSEYHYEYCAMAMHSKVGIWVLCMAQRVPF
jgi:hypothetical protein